MDQKTKARHNFVLAFQYSWNGVEFPYFREIRVGRYESIHTGYIAIDLLDEALELNPDFQEAWDLRGDIWHAILNENFEESYPHYIKSEAWRETHKKYFKQFGALCPCGNKATQLHHKTYDNVGKENIQTDLNGFCVDCHQETHELIIPNRKTDTKGKEYWKTFKAYVNENGDKLRLFPEPDLPSIYGIQIDLKTYKSMDRHKDGAFWLIAFRSAEKLQAKLCTQSEAHYNNLKMQEDKINQQFNDISDELKWEDNKRSVGFSNINIGHVRNANTDQEHSWLHNRLLRLYKVFQSYVLDLQK